MKKLKEKLWKKPYCNEMHFFMFAVVLLMMSLSYKIMLIFLFFYLIFIFKKTRLFIPTLVVITIIIVSYSIRIYLIQPSNSGTYEGLYEVSEINETQIFLKGKGTFVVYNDGYNLKAGDEIWATIKATSLKEPSFLGDFNEKRFYASKGIYNKGKILRFEVKSYHWNFCRLKNQILSFYQHRLGTKTYDYLSAIWFGSNQMEEEIDTAYQKLYCSHILAISGLHMLFLNHMLKKIFQHFFKIDGTGLSLLFLGVYIFLIGFPISAVRAYLFCLIGAWNKKGSICYTKLDILSLSFMLMTLFNPLWCYQQGFILSFSVSFVLLFMNEFVNYKNKVLKAFMTSFLCILTILPMLIQQDNKIYITGLLLSFMIGFVLSSYLLPILLLIILLPFQFYEPFFNGIDITLQFLTESTISLSFPTMKFHQILLYYFFFILFLIALIKGKKQIRRLVLVGGYLFLLSTLTYLNPFYKVTFIDVGQGDSALIEAPHGKCRILVDSFHNVDYLESLGITNIDAIFLSHFDKDHMDTAEEVIIKYKIKTLYYSAYLKDDILLNVRCEKVPLKGGNIFILESIRVQILGPVTQLKEDNANSLVFRMTMNDTSILFTGDMTIEEENTILTPSHNQLRSDILKVGHHGSSSSSCNAFLDAVHPKISIISVGKDNSYGLPDLVVLNRLNAISKTYLTANHGNIEVWIYKKQFKVRPYH